MKTELGGPDWLEVETARIVAAIRAGAWSDRDRFRPLPDDRSCR